MDMKLSQIADKAKHGKVLAEMTRPFEHKLVDPALMTVTEYLKFTNKYSKSHPSSAYDMTVAEMNRHGAYAEYPTLLNQFTIRGLRFELRMAKEDRYQQKFIKSDPDGEHLRGPNGDFLYYTPEELAQLGTKRWEYSFGLFDDQRRKVALAQDEWGCMLIAVASEFRGWGFGTLMGKVARKAEPEKDSGGFTENGANNLIRVHREFVREYVSSGFYSFLVRTGQLKAERAKEIIASAKLTTRMPKQPVVSYANKDSRDWLLYVGEGGDFILYDRKLREVFDDGGDESWMWRERMILGIAYANWRYHDEKDGICLLRAFGAETPKLRQFMMRLAITEAARHGERLRPMEPDEKEVMDALGCSYDEDGCAILPRDKRLDQNDLRGLAAAEIAFRRKFDRYDEFKNQMMELAYAKYQQYSEAATK